MPDSRITDEQSRRIIREELLTNILVEAGAGSGKTQMLAERMAAGVADRRLPDRAHGGRHLHAQGGVRAARPFPPGARSQAGVRAQGQGAGSGDPAAAGGALESGALLRRHHSLVLRAAAARAAGRVRRVARLHRAGRSAGPRAAPARLARVHHQRARGGRPGRGGAARGRHQA